MMSSMITKTKYVKIFHFLYSFRFLMACISLLIFNVSCTRPEKSPSPDDIKRGLLEDTFAPGTADGIYSIKKFQVVELPSSTLDADVLKKKALRIKTSKSGEKVKISISTVGTFVDPDSNISFVNQYYFLNYKPLAMETEGQKLLNQLLGKVKKFKGFPNTVYHIIPHLEDNYLILYRLSDKGTVPYDELPISIRIGDKIATPLVGYPIDYCVAEEIINANREKTGQSRPKCTGVSRKSAKYIHLVEERKTVFQYLPKVDVFPSDFFKGQWFFVKTIIKSSGDSVTGFHQSFDSANLVEFDNTPDSLKVLDASGYEIDKRDQITGFSIPVEWKQYEVARDSDIIHKFAERESEVNRDVDREYFKIKFKDLIRNEVSHANQGTVAGTDSVFITDNYFSFIVKISGSSNRWVKYAFKKVVASPNYVEKRWFETDSSQFFPAFSVARKYYDKKASFHTEEDKKKFERITRFNPISPDSSVKVIKWYFSKQTPKDGWVRDFGRFAVDYWDKAFQEAGKDSNYKIRIVLDESEDKELGDIRYNIINLIQSPQSDAFLLGYGPNIANPITGETLSATANVWITNIVDQYIVMLRKYIRFHIYPPPWKPLPESPGVTDFMHEKIKELCTSRNPDHPGLSNILSVMEFIKKKKKEGKSFHHPEGSALRDSKIIEVCARKIAAVDILNTTLHEMGHGFGYRHVFSASADENNFYKSYDEVKKIFGDDVVMELTHNHKTPAKFSSVMDYGHVQFPGLTVPGKYDIAVTKFIYFDKVDLANGGTLDVSAGADNDPSALQKDILSVVKENGKEVRKYRVCGGKSLDKSSSEIHLDDPLCAQWDYGTTPLEVVQNAIRLNWDYIMIGRNRYDSQYLPNRIRNGISALIHIPRLHGKWTWYRNKLLSSKGKRMEDYSLVDDDSIESYKNMIQAEAERNPEFKLYYEIMQPIFEFYKKIFFLPVKHCIYHKGDEYQAVALEVIKKRIESEYPENSRELFVNCQSPVVEKWASTNNTGNFVAEVGYLGKHTEYFLKAKKEDPFDELSIFMVPMDTVDQPVAAELLRGKFLLVSVWEQLTSIMGDALIHEPHFAKEMIEAQIAYVLEGMDINSYINNERWVEKEAELGRELPRPLPRFISYEIDMVIHQHVLVRPELPVQPVDLLIRRNGVVEKRIEMELNAQSRSASMRNLAERQFQVLGFNVGRQLSDVLAQPQEYKQLFPVISEIYNEYKSKKAKDEVAEKETIIDYFLKHPAVCVDQKKSTIRTPFTISEKSYRSKLCRKFNKYKKCVNEQGTSCENIEDKRAYIEFIYESML